MSASNRAGTERTGTAMSAKRAKRSQAVRLIVDDGLPEVAQAASVGLGVLHHAGASRWDELGETMPEGLLVDEDQYGLLLAHSEVLAYLRLAGRSLSATIAVCPNCGRWSVVKAPPRRCGLSSGCGGSPVKAPLPKTEKVDLPVPDAGEAAPGGIAPDSGEDTTHQGREAA